MCLRQPLRAGEGFDDLAVGDGAMAARAEDAAQLGAERLQVADLAVDFGQVDAGDAVDRFAGLPRVVRKRQQFADRIEGEAKIPGAPDEREAGKVVSAIGPIIAGSACGRCEQTDLFIVAHGLDIGGRGACEFSDFHSISFGLDPVVASGCS